MKEQKILITGGTGMIGSAFKRQLPSAEYPNRIELQDMQKNVFEREEFVGKYVIHLAASVGGVQANIDKVADFYIENSVLNEKFLHSCYHGGVKKLVSVLSTCVYPDAPYVNYPLTEEQLHLGPPHDSNFGYAYAKRMIDVMSRAFRKQYGCDFITVIPNNLYGENDNFDLHDSHVVPALIRKVWEAKVNNVNHVECWGDGSPLREFTYSEDIVEIILFLMKEYNEPEPINIGNTDEYSIKEVVELICKILEYKGQIVWHTNKPSGQHRKPSSNQKLLDLGWRKEDYTPLDVGLEKTCDWFVKNYPNVRGVK